MKKLLVILLVSMFGIFLCACGRKSQDKPAEEPSAHVGGIAPDFTLKDLSGKDSRLSSYRGNVVLLEFWATWCPPCKAAIPDLEKLYHKYHEQGFTILSVSMDSDADAAKVAKFVSSHNIRYPVLIADDSVPSVYQVMSVPAIFIIGKNGTITASYAGYFNDFLAQISAEIERNL